ncbi:hypothetical protein [Streptomyces sp. NBC_00140]|uniref:hypothetical protein n=1 Tax=Streptomyces sp. NBC_00140 TaxID=2975664 RepID=UPI0022522166|nr:hypothetical protein [Streptomyces sp. NBC_00140]MCX5338120.1 hypothetical protein [Streptomyces sp. NBC_00140]
MTATLIRKPSVDHLMDTPLQQLVEELHITLDESSITDPGFTGYAYVTRDEVVVALPPNRSELEHDCMARYLIGTAFRVDGMPPLPGPWQITDMTADVNRAHQEQAAAVVRQTREGGVA